MLILFGKLVLQNHFLKSVLMKSLSDYSTLRKPDTIWNHLGAVCNKQRRVSHKIKDASICMMMIKPLRKRLSSSHSVMQIWNYEQFFDSLNTSLLLWQFYGKMLFMTRRSLLGNEKSLICSPLHQLSSIIILYNFSALSLP